MTDKKDCLAKLSVKLDAISNALEMFQYALNALGCDYIAYGSIADARANVANAKCEIKKESEKQSQ